MDKFKTVILNQLEGQKNKQFCPKCGKDTTYIYHSSGKAKCVECENEVEVDLTQYIQQLKSLGVHIS